MAIQRDQMVGLLVKPVDSVIAQLRLVNLSAELEDPNSFLPIGDLEYQSLEQMEPF